MTRNKVWCVSHGPAHVAAHSSGRENAPRRAAVRAALSVLLLALVLLARPTDALAASNPSVEWKYGQNYVVAPCDNGFDAALTTIGLFSVRPRLTAEMRTKLSNESSGGDFYDLAQKFQSVASAEPPWYSASPSDSFVGHVSGWSTTHLLVQIYGDVNVMWSDNVTADDIANAKRDFNVIQNGGSLGGGGSANGYYMFDVLLYSPGDTSNNYSDRHFDPLPSYPSYFVVYSKDGTNYGNDFSYLLNTQGNRALLPNVLHVRLPVEYFTDFPGSVDDAYLILYASSSKPTFRIVYSSDFSPTATNYTVTYTGSNANVAASYSGTFYNNVAMLGSFVSDVNGTNMSKYVDTSTWEVSFDPSSALVTFDLPDGWTGHTWYTTTFGSGIYMRRPMGGLSGSSSGGGNQTDNWPDDYLTRRPIETEPPVPTPPVYDPVTYPDPTDDPLPTPPPETPVTPVNPIVTTDPTNTTPQDYTPWLQAILNELRNFHRDAIGLGNNIVDALATHCTHITTTIMDETEWLFDQLKAQIRAGVQAILNGLDQNCTEMMNYLEDLAQWLADQLQFTFNIENNPEITVPAYDDGSIIAWLKRIYNAIRNIKGPTIGTPVTDKDVEDGFDWWAWLLSLLDQLFDNVISQTVGEVESFLEEFRNLFPLSIPWDIVAILTMWAGTPTTPQYEFTLFEDVAYLPEVTYEIDLSSFDATAATIRDAEKILFAFYLLFKTKWLLDTLKSATDAAGEFIEGVIS